MIRLVIQHAQNDNAHTEVGVVVDSLLVPGWRLSPAYPSGSYFDYRGQGFDVKYC